MEASCYVIWVSSYFISLCVLCAPYVVKTDVRSIARFIARQIVTASVLVASTPLHSISRVCVWYNVSAYRANRFPEA